MTVVGFNGNGTLVSPTKGAGVRVAISAVANTTPIEVTTSGAHGFNTSDTIEQEGTGGIADGQYQITKVDSTHYLLNGTTANGTASAGYAIDYELQPGIQIPSPGDAASMVTLAPCLQAPINALPFLYRRAGKWRFYNEYNIAIGNQTTLPMSSNPWSTNSNFQSSAASSVPTALASTTTTFESVSDTPSIPPVFANGDLLEVSLTLTAYSLNHGNQHTILHMGFGIVTASTLQGVLGMPQLLIDNQVNDVTLATPITLAGAFVVDSGSFGTLPTSAASFCIWGRIDLLTGASQFDLDLIGPMNGTIKQWRAN
jgi:hypothetical protein